MIYHLTSDKKLNADYNEQDLKAACLRSSRSEVDYLGVETRMQIIQSPREFFRMMMPFLTWVISLFLSY